MKICGLLKVLYTITETFYVTFLQRCLLHFLGMLETTFKAYYKHRFRKRLLNIFKIPQIFFF